MTSLARLLLSLAAALALVGHSAHRIPSGVRAIDVHRSHGVTRQVTDPAKVAQIVRWFDELPVAPHRVYYCPLMRYKPPTTLEEMRRYVDRLHKANSDGSLVRMAFDPLAEIVQPSRPFVLVEVSRLVIWRRPRRLAGVVPPDPGWRRLQTRH